jgi:hypothetical protein
MAFSTNITDDMICFQEAGASFEIYSAMQDGSRWMSVTDEQGGLHGFEEKDFKAICRVVDVWLDRNVASDDPRRFNGLSILKWDHETHEVRKSLILTRGALLEWFDDGSMPSLDEVIDQAQCCGDRVLEIRDGQGALLADRRAHFMTELETWNRRKLEEELKGIADNIAGEGDDHATPASGMR